MLTSAVILLFHVPKHTNGFWYCCGLAVLVFIVCHSNNRAPHYKTRADNKGKHWISYRHIGWVMSRFWWKNICGSLARRKETSYSFRLLLSYFRFQGYLISKFEFLKFAFAKCFLRFDCFDDRWFALFGFCRVFLGRWRFFICFTLGGCCVW